jgi:hypothetical protein
MPSSRGGLLVNQNYGKSDAWIVKYSPQGKLLWKKQLGTADYDFSNDIAIDRRGNAWITGSTFGPWGGQPYSHADVLIAKYSSEGKLLWKTQFGSTDSEAGTGVAFDSNGNAFFAGVTDNGGSEGSNSDALIAKYSPQGKLLWKKQLGTAEDEFSNDIAIDRRGNAFITGDAFKLLGGAIDAWIAKYSPQGRLLWERQLGTADYDGSSGVAVDSRGNALIAGYTYGQLGRQSYGEADAFVAKYSSQGKLLSTVQFGTAGGDGASGIAIGSRGNVFITGGTDGQLGDQSYGETDAFVAKYRP